MKTKTIMMMSMMTSEKVTKKIMKVIFEIQIMLQTLNKKNVSILVLILKCTILISDGDGEEHIDENEMEICDPCHCYGKCCLDVVASIFCVSLL